MPFTSRRVPHDKDRIEELRKALRQYEGYGMVTDKEEAFLRRAIDLEEQSTDRKVKSCVVNHKTEGGKMVWTIEFEKNIMTG